MNILFVCNANSCRSPMAAAFFNHLCAQNKITDVAAVSAGAQAVEGDPASKLAVKLMSNLGVSIENHISRRVTEEMISDCEAVFCMEKAQLNELTKDFPEAKEKARLLLTVLDSKLGVEDPLDGDEEMYQQCFLNMMPALAELADRIIRSR
ncbi:hypothetical protein PQO03_02630 [Lentisphaera profundi]|uniref:protein-tyrosine-phosphatase n=1 Tax=Lentisphaera profundi TaxID=1658616 RepID=A0ABY7VSH7_9BACT|nr:hypothetical protein [Lentisphaera profundi]WDE96856.1 hypothetical protein PQO03_02630 [Lentisphaera profundi]